LIGDPKGVLLSHHNFTSQILSARSILGTHHLTEKDIHISYLPLAHVFERVVGNAILATGGGIGFYFSFLSLFNDIAVCFFSQASYQ
jgi:long-chain acyl-CoA synthetase